MREKAIEALKTVEDPELGLDVWTLGLIYALEIEGNEAKVKMTFTSPMCPYGPELMHMVEHALGKLGLHTVIDLTFSPMWKPSEEVKMLLGIA